MERQNAQREKDGKPQHIPSMERDWDI
jgi:hypothetical protein